MTVGIRNDGTTGQILVYVTASPSDMHLAPMAVLTRNPGIRQIILANGLRRKDVAWLRSEAGNVPVIPLRASLRRNSTTYLPHAEVIELCKSASRSDFCIQDADCFVTESRWWDQLPCLRAGEFAAGPFAKQAHMFGMSIPDTFLVMINSQSYRQREARGIKPNITTIVPPYVSALLRRRGIQGEYYPDSYNKYFDTLQLHWTAAILEDDKFRHLPGEDKIVFHVGGTSYLSGRNGIDPSHWDYWPLNTAYFNLKILESPRFESVRGRFPWLLERYGTASRVLDEFPDFSNSQRYRNTIHLLEHFKTYLNDSNDTHEK